ncbi:hypothetical protein GW17_00023964 [Ensete ventricosum]|nr:hypothetical protein GW17_00023964 [Ensete ventricosum]
MVGDFMVCVDRIIGTAACFEPENGIVSSAGDGGLLEQGCLVSRMANADDTNNNKKKKKKENKGGEMIECRICQEEGDECDMEAPCACNGTLKVSLSLSPPFPPLGCSLFCVVTNLLLFHFISNNTENHLSYYFGLFMQFAHRKCIQKWCNKKGNITCEICNQVVLQDADICAYVVFAPNYAAPYRPSPDVMAVNSRQSWGSQFDLRDSHFLAIAAAEQELLNAEYEDYGAASALLFNLYLPSMEVKMVHDLLQLMLLLFVRQIFSAIKEVGMMQDISALFNVR